ncbi:MAG: flavodoxin reductase [Cyclobacteriaceae bacterium]|nr:flavodoxin reductase [Cyclobacteriaceae bacterium]
MEEHKVKIKRIEKVTHDVKRFIVDKPEGYSFISGQATEVAVSKKGWEDERRPFTFTSLNEDPHLEFTIKIYDDHGGVTHQLGLLEPGDELLLHDVWGAIRYKGPGVFIAGGAGVTPFISILRMLAKQGKISGNRLLFSNKTSKDIILREEFQKILGAGFVNTLTREDHPGHVSRRINKNFLKEKISDFSQHFYVCGPQSFVEDISSSLKQLGADPDSVVFEE